MREVQFWEEANYALPAAYFCIAQLFGLLALVECEGESIDLSGEMGAVGRPVIPDTPTGDSEMHLDLKGTIYRTTTVPSRTFYVVCQGSLLEFFINNCPLFTFPSPSWSPMISMGSVLHFTFERDDCVIQHVSLPVQVSFGQSKAKIEATMNDFIQLKTQ